LLKALVKYFISKKYFFIFSKMSNLEKSELISQLKSMVFFQKECLDKGEWDDFDRAETQIRRIEREIVGEE